MKHHKIILAILALLFLINLAASPFGFDLLDHDPFCVNITYTIKYPTNHKMEKTYCDDNYWEIKRIEKEAIYNVSIYGNPSGNQSEKSLDESDFTSLFD